ncbi:RNA ligase family protein [Nostoc sp. CMAA1605]|uniref:RNA ligase family protein n=1 Tax=Nostoc sp. CMAA1605 TaxID=2055159 RepID=UPI001F2F7C41|nr:RNA ligase family protein [Nostoc sp. CMAA1605]
MYLELYGGKITAASKQYTADQKVAWRLFDVAILTDIATLFEKTLQQISIWRENGGQSFLDEPQLSKTAKDYGFELTPRLATVASLPTSIKEAHELLQRMISKTYVALDAGAKGRAEGIVARTLNRSAIAKLRFEDYERYAQRYK